jgi:hypothetical protein
VHRAEYISQQRAGDFARRATYPRSNVMLRVDQSRRGAAAWPRSHASRSVVLCWSSFLERLAAAARRYSKSCSTRSIFSLLSVACARDQGEPTRERSTRRQRADA